MRAKQLLVAAVAAAVLLQVMCTPTAEASVARKLLQWSPWAGGAWSPYFGGWGWGGWGPSYGRGYPNPDPVGSGCYHPETLTRYRSGQSAWCNNGNQISCNWGNWMGSCRDEWTK